LKKKVVPQFSQEHESAKNFIVVVIDM